MSKSRITILVWLVLLNVSSLLFVSVAGAQGECENWAAKVSSVQGGVQVQRAGGGEWTPLRLDDAICPGDMIRTEPDSRAALILRNEATLRLDENTALTFSAAEQQVTSLIDLVSGAVHFFSRLRRSLEVTTPAVNAAVEGTEFLVRVDGDETFIALFEGVVIASNPAGSITLSRGQSAAAHRGQAPVLKMVARPRDAVQWTIYYPPVIDLRAAERLEVGAAYRPAVERSLDLYWQGKPAEALAALQQAPADIRDARFYTYRAALLLSLGRVDAARADMAKALAISPNDSHALALQSIVAVAQNDQKQALELAQRAVKADARSAAACIALAYARQANFDIKGARQSLDKAVEVDPQNALAWANLAEIHLAMGDLDQALAAANKAVGLNPHLARTQTVLGFANLTEIKLEEARAAFNRAIELDQADPMPRLGLGLALIRGGDLKAGRREMEIAASLDPNSSLIRSYLGKAFYEEKRGKLAADQYAVAKELDPNDPTPWYYDAILKQTTNRPAEALRDLQKSIELNDNRAVYRSRLLLDDDTAARSVSLARIYDDLGFQQAGLVEGWKSVSADPGNYSAHRLLADTYSALPRHQVASSSELLQAQLLQPINVNPVQPDLNQLRVGVFGGASTPIPRDAGPTDPSFNEYTPLFTQDRLSLQANGLAGGNDTFGDVLTQSGLYGKVSYSLGQLHYETDGFRENNDLNENLYNAFTQISISPQTSIQAEFRHTDGDNGDLALRFDPDNFYPTLRQDEDTYSGRVGLHHVFSPNSELIASVIYADGDFGTSAKEVFGDFEVSENEHGFLAEIQHLYHSSRFNLTSGLGQFNAERKDEFQYLLGDEETGYTCTFVEETNLLHTNAYLYSLINFPDRVYWTLGGSGDFFKGVTDRDQFNPKLGVSWNPFPATTLRAALFRVLKRALIASQTVEPTQVAGFSQFFDDPEGTDAWRCGVGLDQKISDSWYTGVEFSRRELDVPYETFTTEPVTETVDWDEDLVRFYLYWVIHPWLTATAEFQYEKFSREPEYVGAELFTELETYRFPLGINFHHPSGFIASLTTTYVDQSGTFLDSESETLTLGKDQFWVVDASIGYRLPNRWGVITLEVRNLLNEEFQFQDTDPLSPSTAPDRVVFARFTVGF